MKCPVSGSEGSGPAPQPMPEEIDRMKLEAIPQPPQHLFGILGNLPDIDPAFPARSFWNMSELYGSIFKVNLVGPRVLLEARNLSMKSLTRIDSKKSLLQR